MNKKSDHEKAIEYLSKVAQKLEKSPRHTEVLISTYNNLGHNYRYLGEYEKCFEYLNKALELADQINLGTTYIIHANLSFAYEDTEQYKLALKHGNIYWETRDSLLSLEKNKQIEEYLTKYQAEKKEKEIALLKKERLQQDIRLRNKQIELDQQELNDRLLAQQKENEILLLKGENEIQKVSIEKNEIDKQRQEGRILLLEKEKELKAIEAKKQSQLRNGIIICSLLLLIPALILVYISQQKVKHKEQLHAKTEEINKQKILEVIRDHELKAIKANIEGQEKERERMSTELHDGIAGNLAGMKLMLTKVAENNQQDESILALVKKMDITYKEVRAITHRLKPPGINNATFCQLIGDFLQGISTGNLLNINFICHPKKVINQLDDDRKIEVYRIIQELVNNVLKHAQSDQLEVQLLMNDNELNLLIEDEGIGFNTSKATKGIGLSNIQSRVTKLKGNIDIDSTIGRGTIINIDIPLKEEVLNNEYLNEA